MESNNGMRRGFVQTSRAWYGLNGGTPGMAGYVSESISIGMYAPEGGTTGEFMIQWVLVGGEQVPRLCMFDDAWQLLAEFDDLFADLALVAGLDVPPGAVIEILKAHGFEDLTPTEQEG